MEPDLQKKEFTALLCGTSGEITSEIFSRFVLEKNPRARLVFLDRGYPQVKYSQRHLSRMLPAARTVFVQADARHLPFRTDSIDYIESDILLNFFHAHELSVVINEWARCLALKGFITTRMLASNHLIKRGIDAVLMRLGEWVMGVTYRSHSLARVKSCLNTAELTFVNGGTSGFFHFQRLSMIKPEGFSSQEH